MLVTYPSLTALPVTGCRLLLAEQLDTASSKAKRVTIATGIIEELIRELKKNFTIVIVTHSMSQAQRVSDTTAFFHLGKVMEIGTTEKIFGNPELQQTKDYIGGRYG